MGQSAEYQDLGFGLFATFGFFLCYMPQQWEFYSQKSSEGISTWMLAFGWILYWLKLITVIMENFHMTEQCHTHPWWLCLSNLQPIIQNIVCVVIGPPSWYFWLFWYFNNSLECVEDTRRKEHLRRKMSIVKRCFVGQMLLLLLCLTLAAYSLAVGSGVRQISRAFGAAATVANFVMWLPQVRTTHKHRSGGSLSPVMLFVGATGDITWTTYLVLCERQRVATWIPNVPDGALQAVLLAQIVYYRRTYPELQHKPPSSASREDLVRSGEDANGHLEEHLLAVEEH